MNKSLLTQVKKDYESRSPNTTELEISFGSMIYPQNKFEANLTHNEFTHIKTSLFPDKTKPTTSLAAIYRKASKPEQAYEIFFNKKHEITLHLKRDKTDKNTYNVPTHSARISVATETTTPIKSKNKTSSNPKKLSFFRFKDRESYTHPKFPNWQFDFTTGYQFSPKPTQSLHQLIKETSTTQPTYHQIEIEYKPPTTPVPSPIEQLPTLLNLISPSLLPTNPIPNLTRIFNNKLPSQVISQVTPVSVYNVNQLKENFAVTEKADGLRLLLHISPTGQLTTINKANLTDIPLPPPSKLTPSLANTLFDTEYITETNEFLIFDILLHNNTQTTKLPFEERYKLLQSLVPDLPSNTRLKTFLTPTKTLTIYQQAKKVYQPKKYKYELDGLIFTPTNQPYETSSLKWKPIDEITIDFLTVVTPATPKTKTKVKLTYYVVVAKHQAIKQHLSIAPPSEVPFATKTKKFVPVVPPFTNTAEITITNSKTSPPKYKPTNTLIENLTIIECQYDPTTKQWLPYRNRPDKTEQMEYNLSLSPPDFIGPNSYRTADSNWQLIQNPITLEMITGDAPLPEIYYTGTDVKDSQIKNMNAFHHYVKNYLYFTFSKRAPQPLTILELSGGRGGDLPTLAKLKPKELYFTDYDFPSLQAAERKWPRFSKLPATFIQTDLRTDVTKILKAEISAPVSFISIQFAFHYMWETKASFENMFKTINTFLQPNGIFLLTTFDGETVARMLSSNKAMALYSNTDSSRLLFKITKDYKNTSNSKASPFGKQITVFGETIGEHPEYLVNFDYLIKHFTTNKYRVLETSMFDKLLPRWKAKTGRTLTNAEHQFSKLNRYIVFQKQA